MHLHFIIFTGLYNEHMLWESKYTHLMAVRVLDYRDISNLLSKKLIKRVFLQKPIVT
jgi:hypothetical protein